MERLNLTIGGMSCGHCVGTVRKALSAVEGVQVEDVQIGSARVSYDPARIDAVAVAAVVSEAGYPAQPT